MIMIIIITTTITTTSCMQGIQYSCFLQFLDIVLSRYAAQVFSEGF
jgi:hypothetical protein